MKTLKCPLCKKNRTYLAILGEEFIKNAFDAHVEKCAERIGNNETPVWD